MVPPASTPRLAAVMVTPESAETFPAVRKARLKLVLMFAETVMFPLFAFPRRSTLWFANSATSAFEMPKVVTESEPPRLMARLSVY